MDRIQFACPACKKTVTLDRKYLGLNVACPACLQNVAVPLNASAFVPPEEAGPRKTPDGLPYKPCPYCTEYVNPHATKCDHCGHRLDVEVPVTNWKLRKSGSRMSGLALAAAAMALLPVLCVLAIVVGHMALRWIRKSPLLYRGQALAEWALGFAYLATVVYLVLFIRWLCQ